MVFGQYSNTVSPTRVCRPLVTTEKRKHIHYFPKTFTYSY